jgi:hypothetical protein
VAGVHDTDYFAKLAGLQHQDQKFALFAAQRRQHARPVECRW